MKKEGQPKADRIRLQFDVSPEMFKSIENLQGKIDVATRTDVLKAALRTYEFMVQKAEEGKPIDIDNKTLRAIVGIRIND